MTTPATPPATDEQIAELDANVKHETQHEFGCPNDQWYPIMFVDYFALRARLDQEIEARKAAELEAECAVKNWQIELQRNIAYVERLRLVEVSTEGLIKALLNISEHTVTGHHYPSMAANAATAAVRVYRAATAPKPGEGD